MRDHGQVDVVECANPDHFLLSTDELEKLTRSTTCTQVAEWLNNYVVAQHPEKDSLREKWMKEKEKDRWAARAGWHLTASGVNKDADGLDLPALLERIELKPTSV